MSNPKKLFLAEIVAAFTHYYVIIQKTYSCRNIHPPITCNMLYKGTIYMLIYTEDSFPSYDLHESRASTYDLRILHTTFFPQQTGWNSVSPIILFSHTTQTTQFIESCSVLYKYLLDNTCSKGMSSCRFWIWRFGITNVKRTARLTKTNFTRVPTFEVFDKYPGER